MTANVNFQRFVSLFPEGARDYVKSNDLLHNLTYDVARWLGFETVPIESGDYSTELLAPSMLEPYWREYEEHRCHEPLTSRRFVEIVDEDTVVWDVGARIGYFTQLSAELGRPSNVYTVEAMPAKCRIVQSVGNRKYEGELTAINSTVGGDAGESYQLDVLFKRHDLPDLVKLDIEGAELMALRSMTETLLNNPRLVIEVHPDAIRSFGDSEADLRELLHEYYDDIEVSFDFREDDGQWRPIDECRDTLEAGSRGTYQLYAAGR